MNNDENNFKERVVGESRSPEKESRPSQNLHRSDSEKMPQKAIPEGVTHASNSKHERAKRHQRTGNHCKQTILDPDMLERLKKREAEKRRKAKLKRNAKLLERHKQREAEREKYINPYTGKPRKGYTRNSDFHDDLRDLSSNKHGGRQLERLRGLRGGTYGPVNKKKK